MTEIINEYSVIVHKNDDPYGSVENSLKYLISNYEITPANERPPYKHYELYVRNIIYINALDLPWIDRSLIDRELEQLMTLKEISPFLPIFLEKLEAVVFIIVPN